MSRLRLSSAPPPVSDRALEEGLGGLVADVARVARLDEAEGGEDPALREARVTRLAIHLMPAAGDGWALVQKLSLWLFENRARVGPDLLEDLARRLRSRANERETNEHLR